MGAGSLTVTATIDEVDSLPCGASSRFVRQFAVITGTGTVSFR